MPGFRAVVRRKKERAHLSRFMKEGERGERRDSQEESDEKATQRTHPSQEPLHGFPSRSRVLLKDSSDDGSECWTH